MLFPVIASMLLAIGAQPAEAEEAPSDEAVAAADVDAAADAADTVGETPAEPAAEAVETEAEAEEEAADAPVVCRRRTFQDAFGKMKSVKSCRPKIED